MRILTSLLFFSILASLAACNEGHIRAKREGLIPTQEASFRSMGFQKEEASPYPL